MRSTSRSTSTAWLGAESCAPLLLLGLATAAWACARPEHGGVEIVTSGPHAVQVGASIELMAQTLRGTDHGYTWTSADETIATVSTHGTVAGVAPGEVPIVVVGADTNASAEHVVVVIGTSGGTSTIGEEGTGNGETGEEPPDQDEVPFEDEWRMSAHADATAEAFRHWNDVGSIPTGCARCHSREGFRDYLGDDGSTVGVVDWPAAAGSVIDCEACHNEAASMLDWVTFPSGVTLDGLGPQARCMACHQGRGSTDSVDAAIVAAGVGDDVVDDGLSFQSIHYFPSAATLFAGVARGGYQYQGQVYDRRFRHVPGYDTCVGCHDPHTTRPRFDGCQTCHDEAVDAPGAHQIRMIASRNVDYDGDGDTTVGMAQEVEGLEEKLYRAIQRYAIEVAGQAICYSPDHYPHWFRGTTGAATECTVDEAVDHEAHRRWTPRLVRAAYNYQMSRNDPGAYVHNGRYVIELLFDSIIDLNAVLTDPIDMSRAERDAPGHFDGASEAARHWDQDEAVSASCSKCHGGAPGFRFFLEYGVGMEVPETANGLECYTCHDDLEDTYDVIEVGSTVYPNGVELSHEGHDNVCATCHSGRQAGATVDAAIASGSASFPSVHYLPAAGVRNGTESGVGYEYPGHVYAGFLQHDSRTQCAGCHDPVASNHTFRIGDVWNAVCDVCHSDQSGPEQIRLVHLEDYDGDGNTSETLQSELQGLADQLLLEVVASAAVPICHGDRYPYWIGAQGDASGRCSPDVATGAFGSWTPELLRAAYNYQLHHADPGAYAHNFDYVGQLLHDSIEDLGGDVTGLVRP